ncbi:MAG: DUF2807 domain-containing protein [Actinomycetota bacterium]
MSRRNLQLAALVAGVAVIGTACQIDIETGSGETVTETYDISEFTELEVSSAFDVEVEIGDEASLVIDIEEDVLDRLEVEQDGDRLRIGFDSGLFSISGPLEARITVTELTAIDFDGAVDAEIDGLDADQLDVTLSGASQVDASGSVGVLVIDADGASEADFGNTSVERAEVDASGASRIDVNGASEVRGQASGASSVDVSPDADNVNVTTSGASSVE